MSAQEPRKPGAERSEVLSWVLGCLSDFVPGRQSARARALTLLLLAASVRLLWAWLLPFDAGPDEAMHLTVVRFLAEHARLPTQAEILSTKLGYYAALSPAPYLLHVPLQALLGELFVVRLGSVIAGTATVALALAACRRWFGDASPLSWAAPLVLALHPQLVFVSSYVCADALTIAVATALIAAWPWLLEQWRPHRAALLGALVGLVVLMKPNAFALLPSTGLLAIYGASRWRRAGGRLRPAPMIAGLAAMLLVTAPFLLHNAAKLDGDLLGLATTWKIDGQLFPDLPPPPRLLGQPIWALLATRWPLALFESSWGLFGYMDVKLPNALYLVLFAASAAAGVVYVRMLFGKARALPLPGPLLWAQLGAMVVSGALAYWTAWSNDVQAQGRYLFPSSFAAALAFALAAHVLGRRFLLAALLLVGLAFGVSTAVIYQHYAGGTVPAARGRS